MLGTNIHALSVGLLFPQGGCVAPPTRAQTPVESLSWHPSGKLLCFGHADGAFERAGACRSFRNRRRHWRRHHSMCLLVTITIGSLSLLLPDGDVRPEGPFEHASPVVFLRWSPDGRRLLSGDTVSALIGAVPWQVFDSGAYAGSVQLFYCSRTPRPL